jgi:hypothetical protein
MEEDMKNMKMETSILGNLIQEKHMDKDCIIGKQQVKLMMENG